MHTIVESLRSLPLLASNYASTTELGHPHPESSPIDHQDGPAELGAESYPTPPATAPPVPRLGNGGYLSGYLWKRGRRNNYRWVRRFYAISESSFCELMAPPPSASSIENVSIMPIFTLDTHSVRRIYSLSEVVRCEAVSLGGAGAPARYFRLVCMRKEWTFRVEQPSECEAWLSAFSLVAERNRRGNEDNCLTNEAVLLVVVSGGDEGEGKPLTLYMKEGSTARDLRQRLLERRGLLPEQQRLTVLDSGEYIDDGSTALLTTFLGSGASGSGEGRSLWIALERRPLLDAPCAGPDPEHDGVDGLVAYNDLELGSGQSNWHFKIDWRQPLRVPALVLYHKRFPSHKQLIRLRSGPGETDPWWREHLTYMHLTPNPIRGWVHLTLVLEGTRETLGSACDRSGDCFERPLLYFSPKKSMHRMVLEPALRLGFGAEGEGYESTVDQNGREIWVIKRPPFVSEEIVPNVIAVDGKPLVRVLYTFVFRNPGSVTLVPVLQFCSRFRILFQPHGSEERYGKFEIQPSLVDLL